MTKWTIYKVKPNILIPTSKYNNQKNDIGINDNRLGRSRFQRKLITLIYNHMSRKDIICLYVSPDHHQKQW